MIDQQKTSQQQNNICLFENYDQIKKLIRNLAVEFGFPRVRRVLALYFDNGIRLRCDENNLYIGQRIKAKANETYREAKMKSRYLGLVINILSAAGLKNAAISNVVEMTFVEREDMRVTYLSDTLISEHQFEIVAAEDTKFESKTLNEILKNKLEYSQLSQRISSINLEQMIDEMGVLNEKIVNYCKQVNLSLNQNINTSFFHQINSVSNDYSGPADIFELITCQKFCSPSQLSQTFCHNLPSVSIIIPAYNLDESIIRTLRSIEKQDQGIKYEVIIVDDGSEVPISERIKQIQTDLSFHPVVIRKEQNTGIAQARNIGASVASYDILLFIDGDVVLTPNYLYEHLIRHKLFNKSVLVSFKENVSLADPRISDTVIQKGVCLPNYRNDLRMTKYIDKNTMGYYSSNYIAEGDVFSILSETNYFKTLGYGRRIGNYDLPSMVIGHNFSIPGNLFRAIGGFDNKFIGYGLEDTFIGIKAIAAGAFVVPVLSCGVYHIDHPTRRGNLNKISQEFKENSEIIKEFFSSREL